jgi:GT2 family glycosyltransferase/glycosyltransferase involved in cell wall biosynthesis/predicted SAM-dependent methyltransferase
MPTPRWLETLYETMESNQRIGIAGSLLLFPETEWIQHAGMEIGVYEDEQNTIPIFPIHTFQYCHRSTLQTQEPYEVPAVTGACMMIRSSILKTIGNLDEQFVNGCEDVDLCFRVKNVGFEIKVVPTSIVFHYEGRTEGRANKTNENLTLLAKKYDNSTVVTISSDVTYNHYHFARVKELLRMDNSNAEIITTALRLAKNIKVQTEISFLSKSLSLLQSKKPIISIIIPVKNNVHFTKHCLQSIREFTTVGCYEIIVIDNNSTDETKAYIDSIKSTIPVSYIFNPEPKTYSESNNQGAAIANGQYLVFLNNDTKLFPTWLENLLATFEEDANIAIQGARLLYPNHTIQHAGIEFNLEILQKNNAFVHQHTFLTLDGWNKKVTLSRQVPMVTGAFLAIRKEVFNKVTGFDEQYRFGHEDLDLCLSVEQLGLRVFYNASIVAYHYESKTKIEEGIEKFQRFLNDPTNIDFQNQQYFDKKWKSFLQSKYRENLENNTSPKRILMTMYGWNESGGGTSYPKAIAKELVQNGHSVTVLYAGGKSLVSTEPYFVETSIEDGVNLYGIFNRPTTFLDDKNLKRELQYPEIDAIFSSILDSVKPEIVHFHNFLGLGYSLATIAKEFGATTYFTTHNYHCIDPKLYMINENLERWKSTSFEENSDMVKNDTSILIDYNFRKEQILTVLTSSIDTILPVSHRQKKLFEEFGIASEKMKVVNQIAEIHKLGQNPQDNRTVHNPLQIGYIGGVMPHKGVHLLIASVQPFSNSQVQVRIFGFVEPKYQEFLQSIDTKGIVQWEGSYSTEELSKKLSTIDLIVLPSLWEDCAPLTITETLGFGKPVVAPSLGGFTDFVFHGVNGYLYNPDTATAIVEILNKILSDKTILRTLKSNAFLPYGFTDLVEWYNQLYLSGNVEELIFEDALFAKLPSHSSTSVEEHEVGFSKAKARGEMPNPLPSPLYLNLGCGNDIREDCVNIDVYSDNLKVVYMDIRKLTLPDGCVDGIIASDVLEHFSHRETESILKEWSRVLKKGGEIVLRSPSLRKQAEMYLSGVWDADIASFMIFGGQSNPGDFHCIGFDETTIRRYFQRVGLQVFKYEEPDIPQDKGYRNINFTVWATKR